MEPRRGTPPRLGAPERLHPPPRERKPSPTLRPLLPPQQYHALVYKVAVQDVSGKVHHAWLRLGSWLRGIATADVAIRWIDGEPDPEKIAEHHKPRERFLPGKPVRRAKKKPRGK